MALERLAPTISGLAVAIVLVSPAPARGQFTEYTQPGEPRAKGRVEREQLEQAAEEARWRLGPVRVDPWLALRNLSWHENPNASAEDEPEAESDISGNVGAGLRGYLRTGPDVHWAFHALPEYVWWADQTERRRLNGRYGLGLFGYFNRLTLQATGRRTEELRIITYELPEEANTRTDQVALSSELALGSVLSLAGEVSRSRIRNLLNEEERESGPPLQLLDRDEELARAGLYFRPGTRWRLGAGVEWTATDSAPDARDLSSTGEAPFLDLSYEGPKISGGAGLERRSLEPEPGSEFVATDTTTAHLQAALQGNRISPSVYARRSLALSIFEGYSHFETELAGASVSLVLGRRAGLRVFAEAGRSDYVARSPAVPERRDDLSAFGGAVTLELWRSARLELGAQRAEFDSNLPGQDRALTTVQAGVTFGAGQGDWY